MALTVTFTVNEFTTAKFTGQLVDENGAGIPANVLTAFTLTLYDQLTGAIINGRNAQDVRNNNGVTVDGNGNVVWLLSPADNGTVTTSLPTELHVALWQWAWGTGKEGKQEVGIRVTNLNFVTS